MDINFISNFPLYKHNVRARVRIFGGKINPNAR